MLMNLLKKGRFLFFKLNLLFYSKALKEFNCKFILNFKIIKFC